MGITSVDDCWIARKSSICRSSANNCASNPFVRNSATTDGKAGRLGCFNWTIETERNLTKRIYKAAWKRTEWERPIKRFKAIKSWARVATCYSCNERKRWIETKNGKWAQNIILTTWSLAKRKIKAAWKGT